MKKKLSSEQKEVLELMKEQRRLLEKRNDILKKQNKELESWGDAFDRVNRGW